MKKPSHEIIGRMGGQTLIVCNILRRRYEVNERCWRCRFNEPVDYRPVMKCECGDWLLARTQAEHDYAEGKR